MAHCPTCNAPFTLGDKFCGSCGAALAIQPPAVARSFESSDTQPVLPPDTGILVVRPNSKYRYRPWWGAEFTTNQDEAKGAFRFRAAVAPVLTTSSWEHAIEGGTAQVVGFLKDGDEWIAQFPGLGAGNYKVVLFERQNNKWKELYETRDTITVFVGQAVEWSPER